jgi:hypothetical protein
MKSLFGEICLSFIPLDLVTEWSRCGETANYLAGYLAHDFEKREIAGNVLSTVINELIENAAKFSFNKQLAAHIVVRQFDDSISIVVTNNVTASQADSFLKAAKRIGTADPDALFAEGLAYPPETGSAGLGLILLRKDYGAHLEVEAEPDREHKDLMSIRVELSILNREVEQA